MSEPRIVIDFKPQLSAEALRERALNASHPQDWLRVWKLSTAAIALMETFFAAKDYDLDRLIERVKNFTLPLVGPRPVAEAISSAGGIRWSELDQDLMLRKLPRIFVAGEMIDWEAPTGGYLLQGCFATATRAGRSAAKSFESEAD
jgi:predicted flavoprotein YhiN